MRRKKGVHVGLVGRVARPGVGDSFLSHHGVAQGEHRRLRDLFGETQISLPHLPRALVSAGVCGGGGAQVLDRAGSSAGPEGGSARPSAEVPGGFCCYSCSLTCARKHKGKAPAFPPQPGPPSWSGAAPTSRCRFGDVDTLQDALSPGFVWSDPVGSPGEPLPVNAFPDFEQSKPFFCSAFSSTCHSFFGLWSEKSTLAISS